MSTRRDFVCAGAIALLAAASASAASGGSRPDLLVEENMIHSTGSNTYLV